MISQTTLIDLYIFWLYIICLYSATVAFIFRIKNGPNIILDPLEQKKEAPFIIFCIIISCILILWGYTFYLAGRHLKQRGFFPFSCLGCKCRSDISPIKRFILQCWRFLLMFCIPYRSHLYRISKEKSHHARNILSTKELSYRGKKVDSDKIYPKDWELSDLYIGNQCDMLTLRKYR